MLLTHTISEAEENTVLLRVLRRTLGMSAAMVRRMKVTGGIFVDGLPAHTDRRLHAGETVSVDLAPGERESGIVPEPGEVTVLYESEWLLCLDKPRGVLTHPTHARNSGTLANFAAAYAGGACHAVNRLDRDTCGVVLFAKCAHAKARLIPALSEAVKDYEALLYGDMPESGTADMPIGRLNGRDMKREPSPEGECAVTHWRTEQRFDCASLVSLRLETGRTHQIRVHTLALGHPVLGDGLYYTEESRQLSRRLGIERQLLQARRLEFTDPFTGQRLRVESPRAEDMTRALVRCAEGGTHGY